MFKLFHVSFKDEIGLIHFSVSPVLYNLSNNCIRSEYCTYDVRPASHFPQPIDESSSLYYIARWDLFVSLFRLRLTVGGAGMYESYFDNFVLP